MLAGGDVPYLHGNKHSNTSFELRNLKIALIGGTLYDTYTKY